MAQKDKLDLGEEKKASGGGGSAKKIIIVAVAAVLLTLGAVFGTLYYLGIFPPKTATPNAEASAHPGEGGEHGEANHEAKDEHEAAAEDDEHEDHGKKKHDSHADSEHPIIYEDLEPAFIVNFQPNPDARVLQITLSVATHDQSVIDAVKKHLPMIRNNLLLLMSAEEPGQLKTLEGKEALRARLLEEINAIVKKQARKKDGIEELFFTGFIMQ